VSAIEGFRAA